MSDKGVTEREVTSWLSAKINDIISKGSYPFTESTVETSVEGKFPDIIVWLNREANESFAFFELKSPGKTEDISKLPEKANNLGVTYFIIWDFNQGTIYEVDGEKLIPLKNYSGRVIDKLDDYLRESKKVRLKIELETFLDDLKELFEKGHIHYFTPDKVFFIDILREYKEKLYPYIRDKIRKEIKNKEKKDIIDGWGVKQGIMNVGTPDFYSTVAKQWIYSLITRIIFYLAIRKHFPTLPEIKIEDRTDKKIEDILIEAFEYAKRIDWYGVFEESRIEEFGLPDDASDTIINMIGRLNFYSFSSIKEDIIGEIFEELIPYEERHDLGQYFTNEDVIDFIIGFTCSDDEGCYCDPTCGSGTFLNRLYSRLLWLSGYKMDDIEALDRIWGIDIAHFPAQLATINLFGRNIQERDNFPRIIVKDFFEVKPDDKFEFPPSRDPKGDFGKIEEEIPEFSGMVGNFPYIRQELIEKKNKGYKNFLTKVIAKDWIKKFPDAFDLKNINDLTINKIENDFEKLIELKVDEGDIDLKLSAQADIYAYLFFHTPVFLEEKGRLGFVTSNSWLDVAYGLHLKDFFLNNFKIITIVTSWVEPWFEDASINTIFTILEKCENKNERDEHEVKFVNLKRKLEKVIPHRDLIIDDNKRWSHIDNKLVYIIEHSGKELADRFEDTKYNEFGSVSSFENEDFIIKKIKQKELLREIEEDGKFNKWGKYLRAPDVYFEIRDKIKENLVPLKTVADIKRGYTTGLNEFFYLETIDKDKEDGLIKVRNKLGWEGYIEEEFLKPVMKSPKESKTIEINEEDLRYKIFICRYSKEELKKMGKVYALKYIEWGEKQENTNGVPYPEVPTLINKKYWWYLDDQDTFDSILIKGYDKYFREYSCDNNIVLDQQLYGIKFKDEKNFYTGYLNCSLFFLELELNSRVNFGDGVLWTAVYESQNMSVPLAEKLNEEYKKSIESNYNKIKKREIRSIFEEVKLDDRKELDSSILKALGLDPDRYLNRIYDGLTSLVKERLEMPKMREDRRDSKVKTSVSRIKKLIEEECFVGGVKQFPDAFANVDDMNIFTIEDEVPTTGTKLHIGEEFFGEYEIRDEKEQLIFKVPTIEKAKFLIYSYRPKKYVLKYTKDQVIVTKAVSEYENYLKNLYDKVFERSLEATHNHKSASRITRELLNEYINHDLPF